MSKSTPLNQLAMDAPNYQDEEISGVDKQVQDVLQGISENFQPTQQLPADLYDIHQQYIASQGLQQAEVVEDKNKEFMFELNNDIKYALMCASVFILVTYIPIEDYILNYISLGHIPHAKIFIKAALAGVLFYLIIKFIPQF